MKITQVVLILPALGFLFAAGPSIGAEYSKEAPDLADRVHLGLRGWFSNGSDNWKIRFTSDDPLLGPVTGRSELEWEDLDSTVPVLFGEVFLTTWLSVGGSYGSADMEGGSGTDTDWLDVPDYDIFNLKISESIADTDGETTFYDVNLYFRLNPESYFPGMKGKFDLVAGYQNYEEGLNDQNGVQTVFFNELMNEPFTGLDSTFDFEWKAFRLGLRAEYPVLKQLCIKGEGVVLVGVEYRGEGFWNLRDDYINTSPNFTQEADGGLGYDLKVALAYQPIEYVTLEAGYWAIGLKVEDGVENTFLADGTVTEETLDSAESRRSGFYVSAGANF